MKNRLLKMTSLLCAVSLTFSGFSGDYQAYAQEAANNTVNVIESDADHASTTQDDFADYTKMAISTAEDLEKLQEICKTDTASAKLYVELENDINLSESDFDGIAYFAGVFEGNGYTISGLEITSAVEPAGFIKATAKTAILQNVCISGNIKPSGDSCYVGGICGINRGIITGCSFNGVVVGDTYVGGICGYNESTGYIADSISEGAVRGRIMTGGIAGMNSGTISASNNEAMINTESTDPRLDITSLEIDLSFDLAGLNTSALSSATTDMGGISGYNSGNILSCTNYGSVGYLHTGYNVGGIAGRNAGYIKNSNNDAEIYGRRDVGGIAGQMEPYIERNLSESKLKELEDSLSVMEGLMNTLSGHVQDTTDTLSEDLENVNDYISSTEDSVDYLRTAAKEKKDTTDDKKLDTDRIDTDSIDKDSIDKDTAEDAINKAQGALEGAAGSAQETINNADIENRIEESIEKNINEARDYTETALEESELYSNINGLSSELKDINSLLSGTNETVSNDLEAINAQYEEIKGIVTSTDSTDLVSDASQVNPEKTTLGAIRDCINLGVINGDLNTGGLVGNMGQESTIDPEDDISVNTDKDTKESYAYYAVLIDSVNKGEVNSKRNYAGGVCGRADVGYILKCANYGDILSEGDYVGGIAGYASITLKNCLVKAALSGGKYVGGVLGLGITETMDDTGSLVTGARALVVIDEKDEFYGAISGSDAGVFSENYFTSDDLLGLGYLNVSGEAENVVFDTLIDCSYMTEEFSTLKVKFLAEDTVVKEIEFDYGDSIPESEFPDLPQKSNAYAHWDKSDLTNLRIDTTVTAVYTSYISSLTAEAKRANGRSVFYIEGNFAEDVSMTAKLSDKSEEVLNVGSDGSVAEQWEITIPVDDLENHVIRYLPTGNANNYEIYVKTEAGWSQAETELIGSYLTFEAPGNDISLVVVQKSNTMKMICLIAGLLVVLLILVCINIKQRRKKKAKNKAAKETDATPQEELPSQDLTANMTEEEIRMNATIDVAEKVVKHGVSSLRIFITIVIALAIALASVVIIVPEKVDKIVAAFFIEKLVKEENLSCDITMTVDGSIEKELTAEFANTLTDYGKVSKITSEGLDLYICGSSVYLENGYGFILSDFVPNYDETIELLPKLYEICQVEGKQGDGGHCYSITVSKDDSKEMLIALFPELADTLQNAGELQVNIIVNAFRITRIECKGQATITGGQSINIISRVDVHNDAEEAVSIPDEVISALGSGEEPGVEITRDILQLLIAYGKFYSMDPAAADIKMTATGGPLSISDSLGWYRTKVDDTWINCIGKNGVNLYYTAMSSCTESGITLTSSQLETASVGELLDIAYTLCETGSCTATKEQNNYVYEIELDQDAITEIASKIYPGIADLNVNLTGGKLIVNVSSGALTKVEIKISGTVKVILTYSPITLDVTISPVANPVEENYKIPSAVTTALLG